MRSPRMPHVLAIAATTLMLASAGLGATTVQAATAPNGSIAYSSWNDQLEYDIYVIDPAQPGLDPARLTTDGAYNSNPDWSPDGSMIAFDGWADFGGPRIQVMDADPSTNDQTTLSDPKGGYGDFQPAWSPNWHTHRVCVVAQRWHE